MRSLICLLLFAFTLPSFAEAPKIYKSLKEGQKQATESGKMMFVKMGRPSCGLCNRLAGYIKEKEVNLDDYAIMDINTEVL